MASPGASVFVNEQEEDPESSLVLEQLATHIPDMVLYCSHKAPVPQITHCYGVIMFLDVSGFTALCESYCSEAKSKHDGTDQLTSTLNQYLSQIVQAILEAEGDILKFAGDAILAFWQCSQFAAAGIVHHVLQQSLMMQSDFDNYRTQDGALLRMKIGLSVGTADVHYIGEKDFKTFDITGECVDHANLAQSVTRPGTVVLSKMAWEMCNKETCFSRMVGHGCVMVSKMQSTAEEESRLAELVTVDTRRSTLGSVLQSVVNYGRPSLSLPGRDKEQRVDTAKKRLSLGSPLPNLRSPAAFGRSLCFRTGVSDHLKTLPPEARDLLRSYVLRVVVHKIDHGQDVSWLSELREVSVLFINLDPGKRTGPYEKQSLLQRSFDVVYPALTKFDGLMNKVFMFDKGCTFLCVFGLPHAKHEDDAARALKTAREIFNNLYHLELEKYSIGVTTGVAFCGVVGHPQRHEYTVIGQKVNMAARLMMAFPNEVVCDESTQTRSGLAASQFTLQPPVTLKGIANPENVYTFLTESHHIMDGHHSDVHEQTDPDTLIGREKEMSLFIEELKHVSEHTHRDPGVIVILGSGGLGKTKLLRAMKARAAETGFRVVSGVGGLVEQSTPFFTVKTLIARLLELDTCKNIHDREQLILEHILDENTRQLLPLLNDILVLKFPQTPTTLHMHHEERTKVLHKLLYGIIHEEALSKPCVFGIDDAHWVDPDSWEFLQDLALDPNAVLVMTMRPLKKDKKQHAAMTEILNHPHTKVLQLEGLSPDNMISLACSFINVDSLPEPLQQIIRERSHGVPLWCEELVETMIELQYLKIIEEIDTIEEEEEESGVSLPDLVGTAVAVSTNRDKKRKLVLKNAGTRRRSSCQLSSGIGIGDIPIPDSVAGMVLTRIDHMSATEQMVLKCAAILGTSFARTMLQAIVPNYSPSSFHAALNTLAQAGIIECAIAAEAKGLQSDLQTRSKDHLPLDSPTHHCPCLTHQESHLPSGPGHSLNHGSTTLHAKEHQPVDNCEMLQFVHAYVQETAYGLWTDSQRTALHESSAHYLESQAHKCTNCGGGGFLAGHKTPNALKQQKQQPKQQQLQNRRNSARPTRPMLSAQSKLRRLSATRRSSTISDVFGSSSDLSSQRRRSSAAPYRRTSALPPLTEDAAATSGVRYNSIGEMDIFGIDLQDCHCDEVLAHVYPQLVRHWRAARDMDKTVEYLIESASAAVATFNNMEAMAFVHEANEILNEFGGTLISSDQIKMETIIGEALLQSGEVEESIPHFQQALRLLNANLPSRKPRVMMSIISQAFRQWLHVRFPRRFIGRQREGNFLERAHYLALLVHAYQLHDSDVHSLMVALRQLNTVEEAEEDIHELVEAYATMIECCQAYHFLSLSNYYTEKALSRVSDIRFGLEDLSTYVHLLNVALNTKLCLGKINDALELGVAARRIAGQMHGVSMEMITLPLLLYVQLSCLKMEECSETLKEIGELASEADDLRAQAVYNCCHFDALLDAGIGVDDVEVLISSAEMSCKEDVYHFDEIERFFLVSCLALWHARKQQTTLAKKYARLASELKLAKFMTYLSLRGLVRYTECCLILWRLTAGAPEHKSEAKKSVKKLERLVQKYPVLKARSSHLKAYMNYLSGSHRAAIKSITAAVCAADTAGLKLEAAWASRSKEEWFGTTTTSTTQAFEKINFHIFR